MIVSMETTNEDADKALDITELSNLFGITPATIRKYYRNGGTMSGLKRRKIGGVWFWSMKEAIAWAFPPEINGDKKRL